MSKQCYPQADGPGKTRALASHGKGKSKDGLLSTCPLIMEVSRPLCRHSPENRAQRQLTVTIGSSQHLTQMGFSTSFCITHVEKGVPCQDREHSTSVCMISNPGAEVLPRKAASPATGSSHEICSLWLKKGHLMTSDSLIFFKALYFPFQNYFSAISPVPVPAFWALVWSCGVRY